MLLIFLGFIDLCIKCILKSRSTHLLICGYVPFCQLSYRSIRTRHTIWRMNWRASSSGAITSLGGWVFSKKRLLSISIIYLYLFIYESVSHTAVSNSLWPHGLESTGLLCPWDSPDKNIGVGCHFLLQGSSRPRDRTWLSYIADRLFIHWATRETLYLYLI